MSEERVTDEELAQIERMRVVRYESDDGNGGDYIRWRALNSEDDVVLESDRRWPVDLFFRLAAELRALRAQAEAQSLAALETDAAERAEEQRKAWEEGARYSVAAAEGEERPTDVQGFIVALAAVVKAAGLEPDRRPSKLIAQVGAALAAAQAIRAPVDVEGEAWSLALALAKQTTGWNGTPNVNRRAHSLEGIVKPIVERIARLAREAEGLRAENASLRAEVTDNHTSSRAAMRDQQHTIEDAMAERMRNQKGPVL